MRELVVPEWLHEGAQAIIECDPSVRTMLLYGSRSTGRYLDDSDWDVCEIHDPATWNGKQNHGVTMWFEFSQDPLVSVEVAHLDTNRFDRERRLRHSFVDAICQSHIFLAGEPIEEVESLPNKKAQPSRSAMIDHLAFAYLYLSHGINALEDAFQKSQQFDTPCSYHSARAAERAFKALCCLCGEPYVRVHEFDVLARSAPKEWRDIVQALNGSTKAKHFACFEPCYPIDEPIKDAEVRLEKTAQLLGVIIDHSEVSLTPDEKTKYTDGVLWSDDRFAAVMDQVGETFASPVNERIMQMVAGSLKQCFGFVINDGRTQSNPMNFDSDDEGNPIP